MELRNMRSFLGPLSWLQTLNFLNIFILGNFLVYFSWLCVHCGPQFILLNCVLCILAYYLPTEFYILSGVFLSDLDLFNDKR
jgi:thiosulfate reductase cytochrome b subunit